MDVPAPSSVTKAPEVTPGSEYELSLKVTNPAKYAQMKKSNFRDVAHLVVETNTGEIINATPCFHAYSRDGRSQYRIFNPAALATLHPEEFSRVDKIHKTWHNFVNAWMNCVEDYRGKPVEMPARAVPLTSLMGKDKEGSLAAENGSKFDENSDGEVVHPETTQQDAEDIPSEMEPKDLFSSICGSRLRKHNLECLPEGINQLLPIANVTDEDELPVWNGVKYVDLT